MNFCLGLKEHLRHCQLPTAMPLFFRCDIMKLDRIIELAILGTGAVYLVGFIMMFPDSLFLARWTSLLPEKFEIYFEIILGIFFCLLVIELYLKYKKLNNFALFFKKYWHEIAMVVLVPFFTAFKILKIAPKIIKPLKTSKNVLKLFSKLRTKKN